MNRRPTLFPRNVYLLRLLRSSRHTVSDLPQVASGIRQLTGEHGDEVPTSECVQQCSMSPNRLAKSPYTSCQSSSTDVLLLTISTAKVSHSLNARCQSEKRSGSKEHLPFSRHFCCLKYLQWFPGYNLDPRPPRSYIWVFLGKSCLIFWAIIRREKRGCRLELPDWMSPEEPLLGSNVLLNRIYSTALYFLATSRMAR